MSYYTVKLEVRVHDEAALHAAALAHAIKTYSTETALELLGDGDSETINVSACLQMLLDPDVSPDGITIEESSVD